MNQYAAIEALGRDDAEPEEYVKKRRDYIIEKCPRLGLKWLSQMELSYILLNPSWL